MVTGIPALAMFIAIPPPIVPPPIIPTFEIGIFGRSLSMPGTLPASRSAKKKYCCALACGPTKSSIKSFSSVSMPSSNGCETAASTQRMLYSGARNPRALRAIILRAIAKIAGLSLAL